MQVEFMGATKASGMVVAPTWSMWLWGQGFEKLRLLFQFCVTLRDLQPSSSENITGQRLMHAWGRGRERERSLCRHAWEYESDNKIHATNVILKH